MHCSLFIPDFFAVENASGANRLAVAEKLTARGRRKRKPPISSEAWLFERFGVRRQLDWPTAPYCVLADGGAPEGHFWMRADPVHLSVGRDSLRFGGPALEISLLEAEAIVETLNRHFGEAPAFQALRPARWYVRLKESPDLRTTPPSAAQGSTIEDKLPTGTDAMRFHALMNEVQMLLHEHPVNTEREARGAPAVNSVWFWGGGTFDPVGMRPCSAVLSDDPLARGLALAAGIPPRRLPGNADAMLSALGVEGVTLVVLDSPRSAELERDWFEPLLTALEKGRIGMLSLYLSGKNSLLEVETVRSDLRYFWRTRKPLESYLA
jgi:hypothetical protein